MVVQKNKTEYPESVVGIYTRIGADHSFPGDFYESFEKGSRIISFMLGPTCGRIRVFTLRTDRPIERKCCFYHYFGICRLYNRGIERDFYCPVFRCDHALIASLEPKSVTTPIAMSIAERSGGIPAIAAVVVIVVGIFGGLVGPFILERLGIKSRIARGLALGSAAHGLGTAKAMELGAVEGAISGLAIGVMGIMTAILVPVIELFIA